MPTFRNIFCGIPEMGMLTDLDVVSFVIKCATQTNVESVGERQIRHTPGAESPSFLES
jgi:hypothetical protein